MIHSYGYIGHKVSLPSRVLLIDTLYRNNLRDRSRRFSFPCNWGFPTDPLQTSIMSSGKPVDPTRAAESNLCWILGVTAAFHGLALILVGLRVYIRLAIVRSFGKDDAMIVMSAVSEQTPFA